MRNKLIDNYGSYSQMHFIRKGVKWHLVGSESNPERDNVLSTLDTFKNASGDYKTFTRGKVDEMMEQGLITV